MSDRRDGQVVERGETSSLDVTQVLHRSIAGLHAVAADDMHVGTEAELGETVERSARDHGDVHVVEARRRADRLAHAVEENRIGGMVDERSEDTIDIESDQQRPR